MSENSTSKYARYALGEILLVVVGILIALQIDNWNDKRLEKIKLNTYRANLITEIKTDLENIEDHIESIEYYKYQVSDYLSYYNADPVNIDSLVSKLYSLEYYLDDYETGIYTIDDLISTGNIGIFPDDEKKAIYNLKNQLEKLNAVEESSNDDVQDRWDVFYSNVDELYQYGYSEKQHSSVLGWQYNLDSPLHRLQNNVFAIVMWLYDKQLTGLLPNIKTELTNTQAILEANLTKK